MGGLGGATGEGFPRRAFMQRAGALTAALAAVDLAGLLGSRGLVASAQAQTVDLTTDTLSGLVAFVAPGDDPYSIAQGERGTGPGGIGAGAVPALIANLDDYVPAATFGPNTTTVPASGGVATLLNHYAERVNPLATGGGFASPFARLPFADKARVFELFESEPAAEGTEVRFVAGILPGFAAFLSFSEVGVLDGNTRKLTRRPPGWDIARYEGVAEGRKELRGYWRGHRSAIPTRRRRRRRRKRGRRR
jgi:hypothetical protein